jgi:hypothetical protein
VIDDNFRKHGSGPAFARMTSQLNEEVARNTVRYPKAEALDMPVKIIWGERDPYLNSGVAEVLRSPAEACISYFSSRGTLGANRRSRTGCCDNVGWCMTARTRGAIRLAGMGGLVALLATASPTRSLAQAESKGEPSTPAASDVPTTKILAIGRLTAKATPKAITAILPFEMRATARLYLGREN